jgi:hypothetical protein
MMNDDNITHISLLCQDETILPSELLSNDEWLHCMCQLFDVELLVSPVLVSEDLKEKGNYLVKLLQGRLKSFPKRRIASEAKRQHWAIKLAYKNLSVVAAYMVLVGHVKSDLSCIDETMALLTPNINSFLLSSSFPQQEGAYLYFDSNLGAFVRSGKVTGRGFLVRHDEHEKKSRERNASSNFYFLYPSREILSQITRRKQGVFQSLVQYIAAGFNPHSTEALAVDKNYQSGGIMILDDDDVENIKSSMKQQPHVIKKFHAYLAYLVELTYDLAIQPSMNVSGNPGFESFIGVFGKD